MFKNEKICVRRVVGLFMPEDKSEIYELIDLKRTVKGKMYIAQPIVIAVSRKTEPPFPVID